MFQFIIDRHPHQLQTLKPYMDELNLGLELFIQYCYLHRWTSTWTERFLSLQRFNHQPQQHSSSSGLLRQLSRNDVIASLVLHTVAPYLVNKLEHYYGSLKDRQLANERFGEQLYELSRVELAVLQLYPKLREMQRIMKIVLWISYAAGNRHAHNLPLWLLQSSIRLEHVDEEKLRPVGTGWNFWITEKVAKLFEFTLKSGAFAVQFLEYWYSQAEVREMLAELNVQKCLPPPPIKQQTNQGFMSELCPICLQRRTNETALSTSGYAT